MQTCYIGPKNISLRMGVKSSWTQNGYVAPVNYVCITKIWLRKGTQNEKWMDGMNCPEIQIDYNGARKMKYAYMKRTCIDTNGIYIAEKWFVRRSGKWTWARWFYVYKKEIYKHMKCIISCMGWISSVLKQTGYIAPKETQWWIGWKVHWSYSLQSDKKYHKYYKYVWHTVEKIDPLT